MARLNFGQIVEQGQLLGQNDAVPSWVAIKLKAWLRKHYAGYAWPFLISQATGISYGSSDASGKIVGAGDGGVSRQISRIFSPIYYRAGGYATRGAAPVRLIVGDDMSMAIGQVDATNQTGRPQSFLAMPTIESDGLLKVTLVAFPVPDQTYTLAFTYQHLPNDCADADIPMYPNEMTLIQAAKVAALEYDQTNDPVYKQEADILAQMVAADRAVYGSTPSFGDFMQLDSTIFLP